VLDRLRVKYPDAVSAILEIVAEPETYFLPYYSPLPDGGAVLDQYGVDDMVRIYLRVNSREQIVDITDVVWLTFVGGFEERL
jgi:hypothetical protein